MRARGRQARELGGEASGAGVADNSGQYRGALDLFHKLALEALLHPRHTAVRRAGLEFNVKRNGGTRNEKFTVSFLEKKCLSS